MHHAGIRLVIIAVLALGAMSAGQGTIQPAHASGAVSPAIVNLGHLDFLHATVPYPSTPPAGHSTTEPGVPIDAWWVYANYNGSNGSYTRTGGGNYDASTNTYGQGAFDTDDVARAAVVYLTHYRDYGDAHSLQMARGALRFVLYMQTTSGPNAGNFVLWMQPDGTLNPSPTPPDSPNPADAGASYWLARALWALGEGYATFQSLDPTFAAVLKTRMDLAMSKLDAELVTPNYGQYYLLHGYRTPKWFISDGADASSEALLGLAAYYYATGSTEAGVLATEFGSGIAGFQPGTSRDWPWGALMPWSRSVSDWHAWGAHMSMALSVAGPLLGHSDWVTTAERDANQFETHQQVSFGPINGLLPAPVDTSQIAYGAETTTDGLLAAGQATGKVVYRELGGIAASWFLGNNPAGAPMYDASTGVVYDGIGTDGSINRNSGAESTIEGLLAVMNAANDPVAAAYMGYDHLTSRVSYRMIEAESGSLSGAATVVQPPSAWTGEAQWSNGKYVDLTTGGTDSLTVTAPIAGRYRVYLVFDKQIASPGAVGVSVSVDGVSAGTDDEGGAGAQGDSPNPDYLWIDSVAVAQHLNAGTHTVTVRYAGGGSVHAKVDALLLQPAVEDRVLSDGSGGTLALYKSLTDAGSQAALPGPGRWTIQVYDQNGNLVNAHVSSASAVPVQPYGYTIARSP